MAFCDSNQAVSSGALGVALPRAQQASRCSTIAVYLLHSISTRKMNSLRLVKDSTYLSVVDVIEWFRNVHVLSHLVRSYLVDHKYSPQDTNRHTITSIITTSKKSFLGGAKGRKGRITNRECCQRIARNILSGEILG